ncbi:ParB/RepB/Spo0J family partition protein [Alicyclobacillus macrosporangiidus]|uniref:ParB/RepB/Spo0J family partition protein n=1 Tax=Alicyclobacillus macrosporangiidus TaxID=392015 RepID=UPI0004955D56|nr:ParB/RepB/Spo0J family partition protein [Alicyclobacillus macrosporangiidus]
MSKRGLGKGLEALIPLNVTEDDTVSSVDIRDLRPNPYQPRRDFNEEKLEELAQSVREHGIIQPLIVRRSAVRGYDIVAGERRFRAAQMVGLTTVPVVVRDLSDVELMEIAVIENLQREDLNPIEIAEAYQNLMERAGLTQDELARRVGQSRSHVANMLRLLQLPDEVRQMVSKGKLTMGHARALLAVEDTGRLAELVRKVTEEGLSVRELESLIYPQKKNVSRETKQTNRGTKTRSPNPVDVFVRHYEDQFRAFLGTPVHIRHGKKRGKIEIEYFSQEDLERILGLFSARVE